VAQKRQHLGWRDVDIPGVRSPPLHDEADPNAACLAGKGPGIRQGRFSRRGALRASVWQGPTQGGASHDYGRASERFVAEKRQHLGSRDVDIAGVRSPPLSGVDNPSWDGLAGKGPVIREGRFSRRDALCASVSQGPTQAGASHDYGRAS
jgi:hypothetical protein